MKMMLLVIVMQRRSRDQDECEIEDWRCLMLLFIADLPLGSHHLLISHFPFDALSILAVSIILA